MGQVTVSLSYGLGHCLSLLASPFSLLHSSFPSPLFSLVHSLSLPLPSPSESIDTPTKIQMSEDGGERNQLPPFAEKMKNRAQSQLFFLLDGIHAALCESLIFLCLICHGQIKPTSPLSPFLSPTSVSQALLPDEVICFLCKPLLSYYANGKFFGAILV